MIKMIKMIKIIKLILTTKIKILFGIVFYRTSISNYNSKIYFPTSIFFIKALEKNSNLNYIFFGKIFKYLIYFNLNNIESYMKRKIIQIICSEKICHDNIKDVNSYLSKNKERIKINKHFALIFYRIFIIKGIYSTAKVIREIYLNKGIKNKKRILIKNNINPNIEYFYFDVLKNIENNFFKVKLLNEIIYSDEEIAYNFEKFNKDNFYNYDFASLIFKKNIAIVGPLATRNYDAKLIDSFDTVVRLNHSLNGKGCDPKNKGLKTDITYFNGEQINDFILGDNLILPSYLRSVCVKDLKNIDKILNSNKEINFRKMNMFDDYQFFGTLNLIPKTILDILFYQPKSIYIFHADLNLSISRNKDYYPKKLSFSELHLKSNLKSGFLIHDPITQYKLLEILFKNNKIKGDKKFTEVMNLGLDSYLEKLSEIFF